MYAALCYYSSKQNQCTERRWISWRFRLNLTLHPHARVSCSLFAIGCRHLGGRIDPELAELLANVRFWSRILLSAGLWFVWPFGVWAPRQMTNALQCFMNRRLVDGNGAYIHTLAAHVGHFTKESWFCIELQIHEGMGVFWKLDGPGGMLFRKASQGEFLLFMT